MVVNKDLQWQFWQTLFKQAKTIADEAPSTMPVLPRIITSGLQPVQPILALEPKQLWINAMKFPKQHLHLSVFYIVSKEQVSALPDSKSEAKLEFFCLHDLLHFKIRSLIHGNLHKVVQL